MSSTRSAGTSQARGGTLSQRPAARKAAKEAADEPVNKRKRMLHLAILFLLLAIILYGTYELLG